MGKTFSASICNWYVISKEITDDHILTMQLKIILETFCINWERKCAKGNCWMRCNGLPGALQRVTEALVTSGFAEHCAMQLPS